MKKCSNAKCGNLVERAGYCPSCKAEYNRKYREQHKDYYAVYRDEHKRTGYYLYVILDEWNNVLYVGATENIKHRIEHQHITGNSHIKELMLSDEWKTIKYLDITQIVEDREEMLFLENELIDLYNTKYNQKVNIIKGVDKLRMFCLISEIHNSAQKWQVYCQNKKAY